MSISTQKQWKKADSETLFELRMKVICALLFQSVLNIEKRVMKEIDEEKMAIDWRLGDDILKHPISYMELYLCVHTVLFAVFF